MEAGGDGEDATVGDMQVRVGDVRLQGDGAPTERIFKRGGGTGRDMTLLP